MLRVFQIIDSDEGDLISCVLAIRPLNDGVVLNDYEGEDWFDDSELQHL